MIDLLHKLFGTAAATPSIRDRVFPAPKPDVDLYVIGDVHGCLAPLERLIGQQQLSVNRRGKDWRLVLVGDNVDRGEDSAGVIALLRALCDNWPQNVVCLKGNHEQMMLDFLREPEKYGSRWLRNGGLQTLASFGLRGISGEGASPDQLKSMAADLLSAMAVGTAGWLRDHPASFASGNVWVVHAGADPKVAMTDQSERHLIWGHADFARLQRQDGLWVVHGHTVVDAAVASGGRISVDTGAAYGGRLSMAAIYPEGTVEFTS